MTRPLAFAIAGVLALVCAIFAIRLAGPWKLMDLDQERPVQYAMDIYLHDRWIIQTDSTGDIASKPPIYPWAIALGTHAMGGVTRLAVYGPTAVGIAGTSVLILLLARSVFGLWPGVFASLAFCCSTYSFKMVHLARTDPLFCMWVLSAASCAWLAWRARSSGRSATRPILAFWAFATLATLTKGPLGIVIAALGLAAILWEQRSHRNHNDADSTQTTNETKKGDRSLLATNLLGSAALMTIAGAWLIAAYSIEGQAVLDKMLGRELIGHAVRSDSGDPPLIGFWKTWIYFLSRFLPWSIIAFIAVARVVLRPSADDRVRRFERFCACWLMLGLIMFSIFPHQRPDLLLPLIPAAALLVGRQINDWLRESHKGRVLLAGTIVIAALAGEFFVYHVAELQRDANPPEHAPSRWDKIVRTREMREFAAEIREADLPDLHFAGGPLALQIFLDVKQPLLSIEDATALLQSEQAAYLVVESVEPFGKGRVILSHTGARDERLYVITND